jgi:hypothetical protein
VDIAEGPLTKKIAAKPTTISRQTARGLIAFLPYRIKVVEVCFIKINVFIKKMALDGFQGGEPNEHEMQRIEPPRRQGRQVEKERLREIKQRKSGIYLSSYTLSPSWRAWRLGGSILRWN